MKTIGDQYIVDERLRGQIDADKGVPHKEGESEHYDLAYGAVKELDVLMEKGRFKNSRNYTFDELINIHVGGKNASQNTQ